MDCVSCGGTLVEINFSPVTGKHIRLHRCGSCNGIWVQRSALEQYLEQGSSGIDSWASEQSSTSTSRHCPVCDDALLEKPSIYDPSVIIDVCARCNGVWLDATELDHLEQPRAVEARLFDRLMKAIGRY